MSLSALDQAGVDDSALRTLIVEDEMVVALLVEDLLIELGHTVAGTAARLDKGLALARAGDFDLAVLDVNLNGERSFDIADALRDRGIALLFASGYGRAGLPPRFNDTPVLQKPFTAEELAQAIGEARAGVRA